MKAGHVSSKEAKKHMKRLIENGLTAHGIARASGCGTMTIWRILHDRSRLITYRTEEKILSVTLSDKSKYGLPKTLINSEKSVKLMNEMLEVGFSYSWLKKQTTWTEFYEARNKGQRVSILIAKKVRELHDRLWFENTEGFYIHGGGPNPNRLIYTGKTLRDVCSCIDTKTHKGREPRRDKHKAYA